MTREKAIENLKGLLESNYVDSFEDEENESLRMAIKALEQEPCDDAISRQAVLEYLKANVDDFPDYHEAIEKVLELPSVQQTMKTDDKYGAFFICDNCHRQSDIMENYCPNCGAKMVDEQESEESE